jgi:5-methylcytosine-specific restriction enzyme A
MPHKSKKPCAYPGCPELVTTGQYCAVHQKQMSRDYNTYHRNPEVKKRYGRQWEKIRALYLAKHPLCEQCEKEGRLTPAAEVHHIVAVADGGSDAEENLMALCKPCHSRFTLKEMRKREKL